MVLFDIPTIIKHFLQKISQTFPLRALRSASNEYNSKQLILHDIRQILRITIMVFAKPYSFII